ncbi:Predicted arabinose efflux permease, MFS family [Micromonospora echinaurantiaca]|uniref:Predicted arabinose efflux permease, MFS family n=1 Tax=Micromonospora echinaurantiaca TaxID=47857 RepID=A0A1C5JBT9_9ACTN|nr:MFS transporter [Micromonospora echinaurantiaca]SCG67649.1 Predicted arabinose efflux permease, MFS family [Micromonospora echinaurantiaca]
MTQHLLAPAEATTPAPLRRSRDFGLLWGGQTVAELGTRISGVAVPLLAADTLGASVFQVSLLTFLAWLPYLLFSLPAGIVADRVDQRRLMVACDLGRAALLLSVPVVALVGRLSLPFLYAVVGLAGVLTVFFTVAYKSVLPRLVPAERLLDANAKLTISQDSAELVGPTIGGVLVGLVGAAKTFLATGATYLVSAVTLLLLRHRPAARSAHARGPLRAELTGGLGFIRRQRILLAILACTTTSNFFVMAASSIEVVFMLRELHASPALVGLVFSVSAVGGLVVGALAGRLTAWLGSARVIWVAMAAPGPLYLLMPLAQPGWGVLLYGIGLAAFSANAVLFNVASMTYRQQITPPELLGRVNAAFLWICFGVIPLGALLGGALGSQLGLRPALWICVLGTWSASLFVVCSPLRGMRDVPAAVAPVRDAVS